MFSGSSFTRKNRITIAIAIEIKLLMLGTLKAAIILTSQKNRFQKLA